MPPPVTDFLPLSPASFHILLALAEGANHGYGIMKHVASASGSVVKLNPGTLYTTIRRLLEDDLIREAATPRDTESNDERRRYYAITGLGRRVAHAERDRLQSLVRHASAALRARTAD